MNKTFKGVKIASAAVLVLASLLVMACSKNNSGESASGGASTPARSSGGRASPASDFSIDLSADGQGIKITGYTGNGGKVVIPATIEDMPVVEIAGFAFRGQDTSDYFPANEITEIVVPNSVVTIREYAFYWIDELTRVTLPDGLKAIPASAFRKCENLTTVNLPASLESINANAFNGCGELNNLVIPSALTSVKFMEVSRESPNNGAFSGCGKLPIKTRQTIQGWGYTGGF